MCCWEKQCSSLFAVCCGRDAQILFAKARNDSIWDFSSHFNPKSNTYEHYYFLSEKCSKKGKADCSLSSSLENDVCCSEDNVMDKVSPYSANESSL